MIIGSDQNSPGTEYRTGRFRETISEDESMNAIKLIKMPIIREDEGIISKASALMVNSPNDDLDDAESNMSFGDS